MDRIESALLSIDLNCMPVGLKSYIMRKEIVERATSQSFNRARGRMASIRPWRRPLLEYASTLLLIKNLRARKSGPLRWFHFYDYSGLFVLKVYLLVNALYSLCLLAFQSSCSSPIRDRGSSPLSKLYS